MGQGKREQGKRQGTSLRRVTWHGLSFRAYLARYWMPRSNLTTLGNLPPILYHAFTPNSSRMRPQVSAITQCRFSSQGLSQTYEWTRNFLSCSKHARVCSQSHNHRPRSQLILRLLSHSTSDLMILPIRLLHGSSEQGHRSTRFPILGRLQNCRVNMQAQPRLRRLFMRWEKGKNVLYGFRTFNHFLIYHYSWSQSSEAWPSAALWSSS
jgi:hypothetical protein